MKNITNAAWGLALALLFVFPTFSSAQQPKTKSKDNEVIRIVESDYLDSDRVITLGENAEATPELDELEKRMQKLKARFAELDNLQNLGNTSNFNNCKNLVNFGDQQPILGIYPDDNANVPGVLVSSLVQGKGAEIAGLKAGDVIVEVDGQDLSMGRSIRAALKGHKAGDKVVVIFDRNGSKQQANVVLSQGNTYAFYNDFKIERDPCVVFIGVYTSHHGLEGRGVRVSGIIDNTPAKVSDVRAGDIILALDGQPVNSHGELGRERDKHKPGEAFTLTVLRDGTQMDIQARFKSCDKKQDQPVKEEVVTLNQEEQASEQAQPVVKNFKFEVFEAYPNPTFGPVSVRFEAEALPTTVRITDMNGKTVYSQVLNNFSGFFNEQVNLAGREAGNYFLGVEQGGKTQTKTLVLLPRA
jgi:C-terminal processing protease CtpA/Prc